MIKKDTPHPTKTKKWREAGYLDGAHEGGPQIVTAAFMLLPEEDCRLLCVMTV